ncbi:ACP S-malonyltransferase [Campylobacter canadensis]|uniref:ACP S-malonyltransferase n=1 Tax=Campylobacter canadensis TaxID=449520 RepID=UPI0015554C46|nr:ACP S-malonyltransferase [Campylobacter canadensis]MBZ7994762.1 ACP S-malonyltransferase [Campylobacter canadensis]MBZ7996530.1 ACP S-malonyltransferase [Campylobacter canadensis]MBZ8000188.1 ACP S-malonyltransferase [Campylobacter canadensis]MBZ8001855.1 ACP S-malonyltransferase [Campylobacter canadensis]MBZ8004145.1 ACP S-malonyltransferase [Campylobacter canadensis]
MNYAFIYAGQGSQKAFMAKDLFDNFDFIKTMFKEASDFCKIDFNNLIFSENSKLNESEFTQPAIVLSSIAHYEVLKYLLAQEGIKIREENNEDKFICKKNTASLGHSLGEFSALVANGAISLNEALKLVNLRGKFMQECVSSNNPASMMVILGLDDAKVEELCAKAQKNNKHIYAANYNCDGQIVVAGLKADLEEYQEEFKTLGAKRAMLLNMSVASHCVLIQSAAIKLSEFLNFKDSFIPVVSNATNKKYSSNIEAKTMLQEQLIKPVLYKQNIKVLEDEVDGFIEFSSNILCGLNKKISTKESISLANLEQIKDFVKVIKEKL